MGTLRLGGILLVLKTELETKALKPKLILARSRGCRLRLKVPLLGVCESAPLAPRQPMEKKNKHIFRDMPTGLMTHPTWKVTLFCPHVCYIEFWRWGLNRKISTSGGEIEDGAQCQLSERSIHFL